MKRRGIEGARTCVVGGCGFLGSHMVRHLLERDVMSVLVLDNLCTGRMEYLPEDDRVEFVHCDITHSEEFMRRLFREHCVEYVFNYAAWPYVPDSFSRPAHVFAVNATGAINVINAAHEAGCEGILQVSSAELYGDGPTDAYRICEHHAVSPHSTYGASKAAVDAYVQVRYREAGVPCIALRQFNCVGERETHPYILPEIIGQLDEQRRYFEGGGWPEPWQGQVYLGNNSRRDFLYAGDAVAMACELLERGQFGEVYNLGSEQSVSVYDLAALVGDVMGFRSVKVVEDEKRKRPWEIWHLQSDNSKIHSVITRRPSVSLREAVKRTVADFQARGGKWSWE